MASITRLPSGSWRVAVKYQGQRATGTARTRGEAARLGAQLLLQLGGTPPAGVWTVGELLDAWVADLARRGRSGMYRDDAARVRDRLPRPFLARQIGTVTPLVAQALLDQLDRDGWTVHRVRRAHEVLSSAWKTGQAWEWAVTNPWAVVPKPARPPSRGAAPSPATVLAVVAAAEPDLRLFLALAAAAGPRRGELVALRWSAVDGNTLRFGPTRRHDPTTGTIEDGGGKTGPRGHRTVTIHDDLAADLRALHRRQLDLATAAGLPEPVWVWSHTAGQTPWRPDWVTRAFGRARARAGVEGVRLHDLRHFSATQLLAAGIPAKTVADRLGHTRTQTTTDLYGHAIPAGDLAAAEQMAKVLGGRRRRQVKIRRAG